MFKKFADYPAATWVTLAAIVLLAVLLFIVARSKRKWTANMLVTAAMCLALSFVLSCIRLYRMPQGGSITPASMLPVMLFSYIFGVLPGLVVTLAYGILQMMQGIVIIHPAQIMLDYLLPFMALSLCGMARLLPTNNALLRRIRLPLGAMLAILARILCHTISGAVFFAEYAGDANPWAYSILYNLTSVGLDGLICLVVACLPPVGKYIETMRNKQGALKSATS